MRSRIFRPALPVVAVLGLVLAFTRPVLAKPPACTCQLCYQSGFTTPCTEPSGYVDYYGVWCTEHCTYLAPNRATPPVDAAALIEHSVETRSNHPKAAPAADRAGRGAETLKPRRPSPSGS